MDSLISFVQVQKGLSYPLHLKLNIHHILPVFLALLLPGLSYIAQPGPNSLDQLPLPQRWFLVSMVLYASWYLIWFLTSLFRGDRIWWMLALSSSIISFCAVLYWYWEIPVIWAQGARFIFTSSVFLVIQYVLRSQEDIARLRIEKEQIETDTYRVQLRALRTKIDPHFLFNSLNTLRSMIRQQHVNAEQFVISLSDFYREILKHHDTSTLPLHEEVSVLESYLFLMKNRNEEAMQVKIEVDESLRMHILPTLALQMVVENCFKHNSMTSKNPLYIDVETLDSGYVEVCNNIQPRLSVDESSGQGLDLLRKRYKLLGVEEGLIVSQEAGRFSVKLKLIQA